MPATPRNSPRIQVALLDDHVMLLETLAARINGEPDLIVTCTASDAEEGFRKILEIKPQVAIMDVELPGRGIFDVVADLRTRQKETRVLILTGYTSDVFIEQALKNRVFGYMVKGEPVDVLLDGIRRVARGEQCFSPTVAARLNFDPARNRYALRHSSPFAGLSSRQIEVLRHLAKGESVKDVAKAMHLSQKSIDSHKYRIMHKLGIHDRVQLARFAIREGLLLP